MKCGFANSLSVVDPVAVFLKSSSFSKYPDSNLAFGCTALCYTR